MSKAQTEATEPTGPAEGEEMGAAVSDAPEAPEATPSRWPAHAPKPKNKAGRDLPAAITTGVVLGALVIAAVWIGPVAWYPLVAVAVALAMWEVMTRLREAGYVQPRTLMIILG